MDTHTEKQLNRAYRAWIKAQRKEDRPKQKRKAADRLQRAHKTARQA